MKYITILKDGSVTGDVSSIIAYEGQEYSEPIKFSYPAVGDEYLRYVSYCWGVTKMENMLSADDTVKLLVRGPGIVTIQFYTVDPITGAKGFMSKPFQMIIHASINYGADYVSNCYRLGCHTPPPPPASDNAVEMMVKFGIELTQESQVRAAQDSAIWEEISKLKEALAAAGIETFEPVATVEDCNALMTKGEYHLKEGSLNTPEGEQESQSPWILQVKVFDYQIIHTIYSADDGDTKVYYRTGTVVPNSTTVWQPWIPMVHETNVEEI